VERQVTNRRADLIDVVEAAYEPHSDSRTWLHALVEAARPLIPDTEGCFALHAKVVGSGNVELCDFALPNNEQGFRNIVVGATPQLSSEDLAGTYYSPMAFATISQRMGGASRFSAHWVSQVFQKFGWADFECLRAFDPDGNVIFLAWGRQSTRSVKQREAAAWARVAAHVAAGRRLQAAFRAPSAASRLDDPDVEAILTPAGKIEHATGEAVSRSARERLRGAARSVENARSSLRYDPERALEAWRGLVAGRWSLVDVFDRDGRRYVIARPNESTTRSPPGLTSRERQVLAYVSLGYANSLIAYYLGLAESTVAETAKRALLKLGIGSRVEAARVFKGNG
jgi:DNA-binding CsgD family transcriptional regulator